MHRWSLSGKLQFRFFYQVNIQINFLCIINYDLHIEELAVSNAQMEQIVPPSWRICNRWLCKFNCFHCHAICQATKIWCDWPHLTQWVDLCEIQNSFSKTAVPIRLRCESKRAGAISTLRMFLRKVAIISYKFTLVPTIRGMGGCTKRCFLSLLMLGIIRFSFYDIFSRFLLVVDCFLLDHVYVALYF